MFCNGGLEIGHFGQYFVMILNQVTGWSFSLQLEKYLSSGIQSCLVTVNLSLGSSRKVMEFPLWASCRTKQPFHKTVHHKQIT